MYYEARGQSKPIDWIIFCVCVFALIRRFVAFDFKKSKFCEYFQDLLDMFFNLDT